MVGRVSEAVSVPCSTPKLTETGVNAPLDEDVRQTPLLRFCCSSALIVEHPAAVGSRSDVGVVNRKMERMPRSREVIDERFNDRT